MLHSAEKIKKEVRDYVEKKFFGDYDVYDVLYRQINKKMVLEVMIDSNDGITVADCERVSRDLSDYLDQSELLHHAYTLEVSSPGAERLLKREVDYIRQLGRLVRWTLKDEETGKKDVFRARLQEFKGDRILVNLQGSEFREFPLSCVVEARVVLEFLSREERGQQGR